MKLGAAGGCEGDVPDIGLTTDVEDVHDGFVGGFFIAPKDHGLVGEELGEFAELGDELIGGDGLVIEKDGAVWFDVDDDLADIGVGILGMGGGGDFDVELLLGEGEVPGDDEEDQEDEENVHHGGNLEDEDFGLGVTAEVQRKLRVES